MVSPASIGPTEAHLYLVIIGDDEPVRVNNAKVPWHDGWENRQTYEQVGRVQSSVSSPCIGLCVCVYVVQCDMFSRVCRVRVRVSVCLSMLFQCDVFSLVCRVHACVSACVYVVKCDVFSLVCRVRLWIC